METFKYMYIVLRYFTPVDSHGSKDFCTIMKMLACGAFYCLYMKNIPLRFTFNCAHKGFFTCSNVALLTKLCLFEMISPNINMTSKSRNLSSRCFTSLD